MKVRQAIREKYGIQKPIRDDDDYEIEDDDSIMGRIDIIIECCCCPFHAETKKTLEGFLACSITFFEIFVLH